MDPDMSTYGQTVKISEQYLGPAGERFMRRQITTHLQIEPEALRPDQVPQLVEWIRLTSAVLTNDSELVEEFVQKIASLSKAKKVGARRGKATA